MANRRFPFHPAAIILFLTLISSCRTPKNIQHDTTNATLWMQQSAEYDAVSLTVYQSATQQLTPYLRDSSATALLEQRDSYRALPPAVILDVDETVLDNAAYQARLIQADATYSPESWNQWVREETAEAIPGALAFTQAADRLGITVIYLTNRDASLEDATRANLNALGFPVRAGEDVVLTNKEQSDWNATKQNQRIWVGQRYRVLMLVGDNLGDFLTVDDLTVEQRDAYISKYASSFGRQWFMLPNPIYGSWESALLSRGGADEAPASIKKRLLDTSQ